MGQISKPRQFFFYHIQQTNLMLVQIKFDFQTQFFDFNQEFESNFLFKQDRKFNEQTSNYLGSKFEDNYISRTYQLNVHTLIL